MKEQRAVVSTACDSLPPSPFPPVPPSLFPFHSDPPYPCKSVANSRPLLIYNLLAPEVNMKTSTSILALILLLAVVISCKFAENLAGGPKAGTVSTLWPDVPPLDGATKADLEIPLGARLMIRAMMQ